MAAILPFIELGVGVCLMARLALFAAHAMVSTLLTIFSLAQLSIVARGIDDVACGCMGPFTDATVTGWAVARVSALAGLAWILLVFRFAVGAEGGSEDRSPRGRHRAVALLGCMMLALAVAGQAVAQGADTNRENRSARTYVEAGKALVELNWQYPGAVTSFLNDPSQPMSSEIRALLAAAEPHLAQLRAAALRREIPDFGFPYATIMGGANPHLYEIDTAAEILLVRALAAQQSGDFERSLHDAIALDAIAHDLASIGRSSYAASATAVGRGSRRLIDSALAEGAVTPVWASRLAQRLQVDSPDDPFRVADSLFLEFERGLAWVNEQLMSEEGRAMMPLYNIDAMTELAQLDQGGYEADVASFDRFLSAFADGIERVLAGEEWSPRELEQAARDGEFGRLAELCTNPNAFPLGFERSILAIEESSSAIESMVTTLREVAAEPAQSRSNAATWYLRATDSVRELDGIAAEAPEAQGSIDAEHRARAEKLLEVRGFVLECLHEAAAIEHCDFGTAGAMDSIIAPEFSTRLQQIVDIATLALNQGIAAGDLEQVQKIIAALAAMCAHLADEDCLALSVAAQQIYNSAAAAAESLSDMQTNAESNTDPDSATDTEADVVRAGDVAPDESEQKKQGLQILNARDPFGYTGVVARIRGQVFLKRRQAVATPAEWQRGVAAFDEWLKQAAPSELVFEYLVLSDEKELERFTTAMISLNVLAEEEAATLRETRITARQTDAGWEEEPLAPARAALAELARRMDSARGDVRGSIRTPVDLER
ncbi:MAG: MauE/DoxX family redox-associated membrane protein [Phycisphaerales bacterium]